MLNNGTVGGGSYSFKKLELCISVAPAIDAVCLLMELFDFLNVFFSSFFFPSLFYNYSFHIKQLFIIQHPRRENLVKPEWLYQHTNL